MAGFVEDFDYHDLEVKTLRDAMKYGPKDFTEDWNTAIACAQLMSEPGHRSLGDCSGAVYAEGECVESGVSRRGDEFADRGNDRRIWMRWKRICAESECMTLRVLRHAAR